MLSSVDLKSITGMPGPGPDPDPGGQVHVQCQSGQQSLLYRG